MEREATEKGRRLATSQERKEIKKERIGSFFTKEENRETGSGRKGEKLGHLRVGKREKNS